MLKKVLLWIFAIAITLSSVVFQRLTGPTHPKKIKYTIDDSTYKVKLPRSGESTANCEVSLILPDSAQATLSFKKHPTTDSFSQQPFTRSKDGTYIAQLPKMPAAGKLEYYIEIFSNQQKVSIHKENPIIIRFKDPVPRWALVPHILSMFLAMLLSTMAGLTAIFKMDQYKLHGFLALIMIAAGGLIFGPIVQYYAFGQIWTGFPLGKDFTDNKTLIAFVTWLTAVAINRKQSNRFATVIASLVMLAIFSIPHSFKGSELNYESGKVVTGYIISLVR